MPKKTLKTIKKKEVRKLLNFKATDKETSKIIKNAKKYANGNVSEWIRFSSMNFVPNDSDLS